MAYCIDTPSHGATYFWWDDNPPDGVSVGLSCNFPLLAERLPSSATRAQGKQLPDFFRMPGSNAASNRFRDLVETFEPGVHFFHPITLKEKNGSPIEAEYYIFSARQPVDFLFTARNGLEWTEYGLQAPPSTTFHRGNWETHHPNHLKSRATAERKHGILKSAEERGFSVEWPRHLLVSGQALARRHLWTGNRLSGSDLWVSDAFFAAMEKARIKHITTVAYGFELDESWVPEKEVMPILNWISRNAN